MKRLAATLCALVIINVLIKSASASCTAALVLGCFHDDDGQRALSSFSQLGTETTAMDQDICAQLCKDHNVSIAGVKFDHQVHCVRY